MTISMTTAATIAFSVLLATSAQAAGAATLDTRSCVSRGEYRQVHRGMTMHRVHTIFGFRGKRGEASRNYRACGGGPTVVIDYTFDAPRRVIAKYRVGPIANDPLAL